MTTLHVCMGPTFILDQRKIEKIQQRATRCLSDLVNKPYDERLCELQLPSLVHRWLRGDLILLFKVVNNYFSSDFDTCLTYANTSTRGHNFRLFKSFSRLKYRSDFFFNRVLNNWNSLPNYIVNAESVNSFKSLLDSYFINSKFISV